ncbi:hypothetical protein Fcan01_11626 [Folsomia candida]|uniref:Uncharacterized protein n=1 Tax=Folsomia candida TaxID=158441 RepID=A0A226ECF1_FOLCA|nr:hypothetical protein Fcan01_11626 [Folsomia candida]
MLEIIVISVILIETTVGHESSLISKFLLDKNCAVHIANFKSSPDSESSETYGVKSTISSEKMRNDRMESYDLILESVNLNYIHHSFTEPKLWSDKRKDRETLVPSLHYKISGCVTFLLIRPTSRQIGDSIEHSGYFLEPSALFLVYVRHDWFKKQRSSRAAGIRDEGKSMTWIDPHVLFSDVTIVFLIIGGEPSDLKVGLFCYLCKEKVFIVGKVEMDQGWTNLYRKYRKLNQDLLGENVAVEYSWWIEEEGVNCDPFQHGTRWNNFTCFPHGRITLNLLMRKFNFSATFPKEVSSSLVYSRPFFGPKHNMVILPGPYSRSYPRNYSKSLFYNTSTDRLFYCTDKYESSQGMLNLFGTLTHPFELPVWTSLVASTGLMVLVVRPKDPVRFLSIIVRQGYLVLRPGKGKRFRYRLLIFWSLVISTSVSFLYEGLLTAEILVPVQDKVIGTFKELILKGFKIGYMSDHNLSEAMRWYVENFRKYGIMDKLKDTFVSVKFDKTIYEAVVNMSGKLAIFREEIEIEAARPKIRQQIWRLKKEVKCYMSGDPLYPRTGMVAYTSIFLFHMATAFHEAMTYVVEAGILNELMKITIWQNSKLPKMPWERELNSKNVFKPAGLTYDSKMPVIFLLYVFGVIFAGFVLLVEVVVTEVRCSSGFVRGKARKIKDTGKINGNQHRRKLRLNIEHVEEECA